MSGCRPRSIAWWDSNTPDFDAGVLQSLRPDRQWRDSRHTRSGQEGPLHGSRGQAESGRADGRSRARHGSRAGGGRPDRGNFRTMKRAMILLASAGTASVLVYAAAAQPQAAATAPADHATSLLTKYCGGCHGGSTPRGDVALRFKDDAEAIATAGNEELWTRVASEVGAGQARRRPISPTSRPMPNAWRWWTSSTAACCPASSPIPARCRCAVSTTANTPITLRDRAVPARRLQRAGRRFSG